MSKTAFYIAVLWAVFTAAAEDNTNRPQITGAKDLMAVITRAYSGSDKYYRVEGVATIHDRPARAVKAVSEMDSTGFCSDISFLGKKQFRFCFNRQSGIALEQRFGLTETSLKKLRAALQSKKKPEGFCLAVKDGADGLADVMITYRSPDRTGFVWPILDAGTEEYSCHYGLHMQCWINNPEFFSTQFESIRNGKVEHGSVAGKDAMVVTWSGGALRKVYYYSYDGKLLGYDLYEQTDEAEDSMVLTKERRFHAELMERPAVPPWNSLKPELLEQCVAE